MGTWNTFNVRGQREEHRRAAIVETALDVGTTLFDTSPMYGMSEQVLANALRGRRERAIVADKVWTASPREGREQITRALDWYDGKVEIYQIHNLVAWKEHLPVLEELREKGSVVVIGATHYQHSAFSELIKVMESGRIQMVQVPYNPKDRTVELELLPLARAYRVGVLVMQPLGTGSLVRRSPTAKQLEPLAPFGVHTWAQAILKWILSDARVHGVLPATSNEEHARENSAAGDPPWLDDETRDYVAHLVSALGSLRPSER
jgi:aryl-alcohol dehydrogenase-like predicted oxidoreductase